MTIAACLHVTAETANLVRTFKAGGANVVLCASNPLSTQDDVAASLVKDFGIPRLRHPRRGPENLLQAHQRGPRRQARDHDGRRRRPGQPAAHEAKGRRRTHHRLDGRNHHRRHPPARDGPQNGMLKFPVFAVNDAETKHLFDNRYGTGQSTLDGIIRATDFLMAGKNVVVAGYGWCGRGLRHAGTRHGRHRDRHRDRPAQGPRSDDGRLQRHADGRGRQNRRPVRHAHRQQARHPARSTSST